MAELSPRQLEILQHALGVDKYGLTPKGYTPYTRNRFCAGVSDEPDCRALVEMGLMDEHARTEWLPYFNCSVTTAGMKAMHAASAKPPKVSRSTKRFEEYRACADAFDCTFRAVAGYSEDRLVPRNERCRMTPTELLMKCAQDFSACEPKEIVIIYTNEEDDIVVEAHISRTHALGIIEAAKQIVLER